MKTSIREHKAAAQALKTMAEVLHLLAVWSDGETHCSLTQCQDRRGALQEKHLDGQLCPPPLSQELSWEHSHKPYSNPGAIPSSGRNSWRQLQTEGTSWQRTQLPSMKEICWDPVAWHLLPLKSQPSDHITP